MEARIRQTHPDANIELIRSRGGVFEVTRNDELIFSKQATGLFPSYQEIESKL